MSSKFDWSQFEEVESPKGFDWSQFQQVEPESEQPSDISQAPRHIARSGARIAETALGLPGDIMRAAATPLNAIVKQTKKHLGIGNPKTEEEIEEAFKSVPTSKTLRGIGQKLTGGFLEPRSEGEKSADEYFELATSLAIPGPKTAAAGKVIQGLKKAGGLAALATGTKEGLKSLGIDEDAARVASYASLMVPGLVKGKNVKKVTSELYKEAEKLLPAGAVVNSANLVPSVRNTVKVLSTGTSTPSKSAALKTAKDLLRKSASGHIGIEELTAFKRDINELMKDPANLRGGQNFLKGLGKEVDTSLAQYGKRNPDWFDKYKTANEMFGGLANAKRASNFLGKYSYVLKNPLSYVALGLIPQVGLSKVAAAYAGKKGYELLRRITDTPSLRKFYGNVVKEAGKESSKSTIHFLKKFDKEMGEEFPEE